MLPVQVPLFQQMDDLVLNNICERLKPGLFIKDETVGPLTQKIIVIGVLMSSMMGLTNRVFLRVSPGDQIWSIQLKCRHHGVQVHVLFPTFTVLLFLALALLIAGNFVPQILHFSVYNSFKCKD